MKKPLATVSAMNDEENHIQNDATGEKIMIERVGDRHDRHDPAGVDEGRTALGRR